MNAKTFAHQTQSRVEQAIGLRLKRSHVYELMASALGASSYASFLSQGLLCALPSDSLKRKYAQLEPARAVARAVDLGYPDPQAASIAAEVCAAIQEGDLGLVPMEAILMVLWRGFSDMYDIEEQDYDPSDDLDDLEWHELLDQPDSNALDLSGFSVFGALQSAAARGDGRAHLAMALIEDLALQDEADFDQPQGRDGIYWYERGREGHPLSGVEKEWADSYEARSQGNDPLSQRRASIRQHLEEAAALGQHDALLLIADKYDDDRFFDLVDPVVRADPRWIASVAERVGRYECAPGWLTLAAEQGSIEAMRDLIEQHDRDDPLKCWTWFYLAQRHGTDLTRDDYHAIHENGDPYDDDVGGALFADGLEGIELPVADDTVKSRAKAIAKDLFDRRDTAIRGDGKGALHAYASAIPVTGGKHTFAARAGNKDRSSETFDRSPASSSNCSGATVRHRS